jgi:son of sevenless-like protein
LVTEVLGADITTYCPPLMVNLLHSLSLLQSAARSNRIAHFQPSTACIISCVRFILSSTECLPREAPLLKHFPPLASERKQILSVLATLVSQAKKASDETQDEDSREADIEGMLKLGGQVFSQVRRFLAVAVQCGIDLPERRQHVTSDEAVASSRGLQGRANPAEAEGGYQTSLEPLTPPRMSSHQATQSHGGVLQKTAPRTKSMGDLRSQRRLVTYHESDYSVAPLLPHRMVPSRSRYLYDRAVSKHKPDMPSVSSISSSSSFSSAESAKPPAIPPFPSGPSTSSQVTEALKFTHGQYLSTIAAFIGHAHSHSRSSHASSTGQMYDLVREVVEMVCKLLTIVEAVMRHPEISSQKIGNLRSTKERLYVVTSSLAESVRLLTMPLPPDLTEEREKASLIRSATAACKAGTDCASAVKICLNRASGERQFIIQIPTTVDSDPAPFTPSKFSRRTDQTFSPSLSALRGPHRNGVDEEDITIQAVVPPRNAASVRDESSDASNVTATSASSHETLPTTPEGGLSSLSDSDVTKDHHLSSPSPTVDDACEPADQQDRQTIDTFEERLTDDDLPASLQVKRDPLGHDYSSEDVIYNSEGHMVAATMEALFERMTPHDSIVDAAFSAIFFLTFRLFTTPLALVEAIIDRYNIMPPPDLSEDALGAWQSRKGLPIRLRVSNFIKTWLEMYWRSGVDDVALPHLASFTRDALLQYFPAPSQRILDLISIRQDSSACLVSPKSERARDPGMSINPLNPPSHLPSEIPRPTMTKALLATLRSKNFDSVAVTDFDALELARQLTIMECDLYCAIQPEEVLETGQEGSKPPVNVRAVSSLSTVITGWVAENILGERDIKKRTILVKFFIKVGDVSEYETVTRSPE